MSPGPSKGLGGDSWLHGLAYRVWNIKVCPCRVAADQGSPSFFLLLHLHNVLLVSSPSLSLDAQKGPVFLGLSFSPLVGRCQSHWAVTAGAVGRAALVTRAWPARELGVVGGGAGRGCRPAVSSASCTECPPEPFPLVLSLCLPPTILGRGRIISAHYPDKSWVSNVEGMLTSNRHQCSH